ncbi:MAG: hypothetical protein JWO38_1822 [Gemmataceae bacterium]|nr:hypothetical protein [Gemmataceae bacterium]
MPIDPNSSPREDDGPEPSPAEAELIAYLDGELDPPAARKLEAKLAADPKLRARAEALKRSYDLLDFLPKPEPTSTFTTRTLEKLPPVAAASAASAAVTAVNPATTPGPRSTPGIVATSLSGVPVAGDAPHSNPSAPVVAFPRTRRPWVWAAGILVAAGLALGTGYIGTGAVRSYFLLPSAPRDTTAYAIPLADLRVVEHLPLYAAVDDLDFLDRLASPDFFGEDPLPPEGLTLPHPVEPEKPVGHQFDQLAKTFRELAPDQQEKMRELDHQLYELEPARRDRSVRLLESYAAWLYRLPDHDRKAVLSAPSAEKRLGVIRDVRNGHWVENLPAEQRKQLKSQPAAERAVLIAQWRAQEDFRREGWQSARAHWEFVRTGKPPWPFQDDRMKKEVLEFATAAYHPDDLKRCRLTTADRERLVEAIKESQEVGEKAYWFPLGKVIYEFSKKPQYELLPEPANGKPVVNYPDLDGWEAAQKLFARPLPKAKINPHIGKWPDFALEVLAELNRTKLAGNTGSYHLGPCRAVDFKEDVRRVILDLQKKSTPAEAKALKDAEGKWPDYPRELARLARAHDMSVPGVMPPGPPSMWEKTYNTTTRPPAPKAGG